MEYRWLGKTGLKVSRMCFGALTIGPLQDDLPLREGAAVIRYALEKGVNFIDTAHLYGTYPYIREALQGFSGEVIIASKSYAYTARDMEKQLQVALEELSRDYVDIFLLHEQESELTLRGHWEAVEYLLKAREKGLVRAIGLSTHRISGVEAAIKCPEMEVIHPIYNYSGIGIGDGTVEGMGEVIAQAAALGKGIYGMKPLGGGHLIKDVQKAVQFVLGNDNLASIAVGMKTKAEVEMNLRLFKGEEVPVEILEAVKRTGRRLHIEGWCQGCGQCVDRCPVEALHLAGGKVQVDAEKCCLCGYCGAVCNEFCLKII